LARIIVMPRARRDVDAAIGTLELPADSWSRIAHALRVVETFPRSGPKLEGQLAGNRYVLGPWRWMVLVYHYDEASDLVFLLAMIDARSSLSPLH
jgi:hypothetical protein